MLPMNPLTHRVSVRRIRHFALAAAAAATVAACKVRDRSTPAGATAGAGAPGASRPTSVPKVTGLSDANILAVFDEVNMADSTLGDMAAARARRSDVKDFAKLMSNDHHALRLRGQQVAAAQHISPEMPTTDPFRTALEAEQDSQGEAPQGRVFDSTYITKEIELHQTLMAWTAKAAGLAKHPALRDYLTASDSILQRHLDRARAIAGKLTS
jgi:predicted outer membrane protein